jgi:hypothetical protein
MSLMYGCPAELPDNVHIYIDLLRRLTGFSVPKMKRLLGGLNSLGFSCAVVDSHDDDHGEQPKRLGKSQLFQLEWADLMAGSDYPEMLVAVEMIHGATEGYCHEHGLAALRRLDFSQLATVTTVEDHHASTRSRKRKAKASRRGKRA